jgi:hypothetical protein
MDDREVEELRRIWELKEKGAISEEEYAQLKSRILVQRDEPKLDSASETNNPDFAARVQPSPTKARSGPTAKQAAGIGCLLLVGLLFIAGLIGSNTAQGGNSLANGSVASTDANVTSADTNAKTSDAGVPDVSPWSYSEDEDKVRGGTTYYARTTSTNSIAQSFPYDSDTTMTIAVRKSPAYGTDVILTISSGQMMCPSYEGCRGTVRFDSGPAQHVSFNGPADNSSDTVFVEGANQFIAKLKKAKKVTIEKTLYEAGNPQFEFDVHGLKWDH